jgi:hypothetical protein
MQRWLLLALLYLVNGITCKHNLLGGRLDRSTWRYHDWRRRLLNHRTRAQVVLHIRWRILLLSMRLRMLLKPLVTCTTLLLRTQLLEPLQLHSLLVASLLLDHSLLLVAESHILRLPILRSSHHVKVSPTSVIIRRILRLILGGTLLRL